jgi:RND family efflux transporter MFP subunit
MKSKKIRIILLFVVLGVALGVIVWRTTAVKPIQPGRVTATVAEAPAPAVQATAEVEQLAQWYEAVGTLRPRTESNISAQVTAQILSVEVNSGDRVGPGDLLVKLDDRQFRSRQDQARRGLDAAVAGRQQAGQAVEGAKASFARARSEYDRIRVYHEQEAATLQQLEQAESAFRQAEAELQRARDALEGARADVQRAEEVVREASIALDYTRIVAPSAGEVIRRACDPGDMALPGKTLVALRTSGKLRIEAYVREGLIERVQRGAVLPVTLGTREQRMEAVVEEIVPYADPRTRTFLVKASVSDVEGLFPGMYGKLLLPVAEQPAVVIPAAAVRRVGQLETVRVREGNEWRTLYIQTGRRLGDRVEVLAGLSGNETIGWED